MSRRWRNPSTGAIVAVLLVGGGLAYWYFTKEAKAKPKAATLEPQLYRGWKITVEPDRDPDNPPWHWLAYPQGKDPELLVVEGGASSVAEAFDSAKREIDQWEDQ